MKEEKEFITPLQAISLLPEGEEIHTFRNPGAGMMIGCDWSRTDIIKALSEAGPEEIQIGGPSCRNMNHAIVLQYDGAPLFIESRLLAEQEGSR